MISITEKAVNEIKRVMTESNLEGSVLRVHVSGSGCSGINYGLSFCKKEEVDLLNDNLCEVSGLEYSINRNTEQLISGTVIDFYDSIEKRGFMFNNPNIKQSGGCGGGSCGSGGCGG